MTAHTTRRQLTLGQQLRQARIQAGLKPKDLARRAKLSVAAVYNCERYDRGGRMRTLLKLARALGCKVRIPDLATAATDQGHTETTLAEAAQIAFDTVRSLLARPSRGNVKSLEKLFGALGQSLQLVL
jgi:transcriptional regulator with XRE-family HTH domain